MMLNMETIAITNWNGIISPMFDASCWFLILQPGGNRVVINVKEMSLFEKIDCCYREGVNTLICGAISSIALAILQDKNIKVLSWIHGPVEEIIDAYLKKVNIIDVFSIPDCKQMMCGRKKRFRNRGGKL